MQHFIGQKIENIPFLQSKNTVLLIFNFFYSSLIETSFYGKENLKILHGISIG